jgi:DNA-binding NtrC family response regulator
MLFRPTPDARLEASMPPNESRSPRRIHLDGKRVLVVEDEYYIADDLRRILEAVGAKIVGPLSTVARAHRALDDDRFDCAVIDLNLHGESALPIADRLQEAGKSFAIATGYGSGSIPDRFKDVPRVEKPFNPPALLELVGQLSCAQPD